eukprot:1855723-Amphidinium_carterae.1
MSKEGGELGHWMSSKSTTDLVMVLINSHFTWLAWFALSCRADAKGGTLGGEAIVAPVHVGTLFLPWDGKDECEILPKYAV